MRACVIDFVNSTPYRYSLERGGIDVETAPPRECGFRFAAGDVDAALVPVRHAWILEANGAGRCTLPFGIASAGATRSTLLFGPDDLHVADYARITTNGHSSSTAALCQLLLEEHYGHRRVVIERAQRREGTPHLIIGDEALTLWHASGGQPEGSRDVGDLWWSVTAQPFVFARWIVRGSLPPAEIARLHALLNNAAELASGAIDFPREYPSSGGLEADFLRSYWAHLRFRLESEDARGEQLFRAWVHRRPESRPIYATRTAGDSFWQSPRNGVAYVDPNCDVDESVQHCRAAFTTGRRPGAAEIAALLTTYPASELFARAHRLRCKKNDPRLVTYVVDSNPNYSNVCDAYCSFCAFYVPPNGSRGAYEHSVDAMLDNFRRAAERGATTILLQGGHHPALPLDYYLELVRRTRLELPHVIPHFWSAGEIRKMAQVSGLTIREVIRRLVRAGQVSLPGGGAEILSNRVRSTISPLKGSVESWLEVHRIAHEEGMRSTATMMYGHVEAASDIAAHLLAIRELQDLTGGFTAFVPWSFKRGHTPLGQRLAEAEKPGVLAYLRVIAAARLALDNVQHVQASFFSEGWDAGELALHCGADDVGGVLLEENVHKAAGFQNATPLEVLRDRIERAGFSPFQRDTLYQPVTNSTWRPGAVALTHV